MSGSKGVNPRNANGNARRKLRARVKAMGLPCHICGRPIDYGLPAGDPWSFEVDEIRPVSRWREFGYPSPTACALDPDNVAPAHRICNERRGNATLQKKRIETVREQEAPRTSTDW